ncbi:carbohydrate ABC transporter permease [Cohnella herbarum]|uniref:Carbohydrate ABC transporter permease n=1 Tax=Cohnella herbarum TaxID=2728023 RepID=A0A7Z2ZNI1_9BACL|nr:carbohydrate ABC transporter permease [Cohnella herbarum]QJD86466.1 carbohydrate ABC transporter permease [Cohnella herbarum]
MASKKMDVTQACLLAIVSILCILCIIPFLMVISGSLSTEKDIVDYGYTLIPKHLTLLSYKVLLLGSGRILDAYGVTVLVTAIGTVLALLVNSMGAYVLTRKALKYRNILSVYALITLLFNGGMVPWYFVCVNYLHLQDSLLALILPALGNAFNMYLVRNYMLSVPEEIYESAKMDGAGDLKYFFRFMLPLSKPVLATVGLFTALAYWNDWFIALMLVNKQELQPLQLILRTIVSNIEFVKNSGNAMDIQRLTAQLPSEGIKMAATVITIGPIVFLYPFVQKYFVKGIMIGAVKG